MEIKGELLKKIIDVLKRYGKSAINNVIETTTNISKTKNEKSKQILLSSLSAFTDYILRLSITFIPFLGSFYPALLSSLFWVFLIFLIVIIIVWILLKVVLPIVFPPSSLVVEGFDILTGFSKNIRKTIIVIFLLIVSIIVVSILPSPDYPKLFTRMNLSTTHYYTFLIVFLVFAIFLPTLDNIFYFALATITYTLLLYFAIPLITLTSTTLCLDINPIYRIPYISTIFSDRICKEEKLQKTSLVVKGREIVIPSSGGISITIGYDSLSRLPAGHRYQEVFFLQNNYLDPEDENRTIRILDIVPYIYYPRYELYFKIKDYTNDKEYLKPGEVYGNVVVFDPEKLYIEGRACPYTAKQLEEFIGTPECAFDLSCTPKDNVDSICVEIGYLNCRCINWIDVTCSGTTLYMGVDVTHDGFVIGNGTLYYFEQYSPSRHLNIYSYTQGPAKISFNFIPNPWIREMYENYIDTIDMFGNIEIGGKNQFIRSIQVKPIETKVIIYDYANNKKIIETIGIRTLNCVDKDEINEILTKTGKWSGILCKFTPPEVSLEILDLSTNETTFNTSLTLTMLNYYCNQQVINISEEQIKYNLSLFKEYLLAKEKIKLISEELRSTINEHGLCSLLNKTHETRNETLKQKTNLIESTLKEINVYVRIEYTTTSNLISGPIYSYWTSRCER